MSDDPHKQQTSGPDITEDPRQQGTGQGYPESNPEGSTPKEGTEPGQGPEGESKASGTPDAPSEGMDEMPSTATGNPRAAGG